jgi:hypothetical protein
VAEANGRRGFAVDDEVTSMHGAASGARPNVMEVDHFYSSGRGSDVIAMDKRATHGGWGLRRACAHVGVGFERGRGGRRAALIEL